MKITEYLTTTNYEIKTGMETPFKKDRWYVYLNGEMFTEVSGPIQGLEIIMRDETFMRELLLIYLNKQSERKDEGPKKS